MVSPPAEAASATGSVHGAVASVHADEPVLPDGATKRVVAADADAMPGAPSAHSARASGMTWLIRGTGRWIDLTLMWRRTPRASKTSRTTAEGSARPTRLLRHGPDESHQERH